MDGYVMEPINTYLIGPILIYGYLALLFLFTPALQIINWPKRCHSISFPLNNSCAIYAVQTLRQGSECLSAWLAGYHNMSVGGRRVVGWRYCRDSAVE